MSIEKYVGKSLDIIYVNDAGQITQRRITVHSVKNDRIRAFDHSKRAFRVFKVSNILANKPVNGYAS